MLRAHMVCSLLGFSTGLILHQRVYRIVENTGSYMEKLISTALTTLSVSFSYSKQRFPIRIQPTPSLAASRSQLYGVASRAYQTDQAKQALLKFYYSGGPISPGGLSFEPVVDFRHFGLPSGQVRSNKAQRHCCRGF